MIISRRQKEVLMDEMARMLANKQHVAFATHSKQSERLTNGDLSLYINSPDKEFIIKYGNNQMRLNAKEKTFSELTALIFSNRNKITGITDSSTSSSTIALSAKWAYNKDIETLNRMKKYNPKTSITSTTAATITGITDDGTHFEQHLLTYEYWKDNQEKKEEEQKEENDNKYALKEHTHNDLATKTELSTKADVNHTHSDLVNKIELNTQLLTKADITHTHQGLWTEDELIDLIGQETETPWYEKLFNGLHTINEVAQDGYIYWLQNQIAAIWEALAANGIVDAAQTGATSLTGLGSLTNGIASKFQTFTNALNKIGEKFPKLQNAISKITNPIQNISNRLSGYQHFTDIIDDVRDFTGYSSQVAHHIGSTGSLNTSLLPDVVGTLSKGGQAASQLAHGAYSLFRSLL